MRCRGSPASVLRSNKSYTHLWAIWFRFCTESKPRSQNLHPYTRGASGDLDLGDSKDNHRAESPNVGAISAPIEGQGKINPTIERLLLRFLKNRNRFSHSLTMDAGF